MVARCFAVIREWDGSASNCAAYVDGLAEKSGLCSSKGSTRTVGTVQCYAVVRMGCSTGIARVDTTVALPLQQGVVAKDWAEWFQFGQKTEKQVGGHEKWVKEGDWVNVNFINGLKGDWGNYKMLWNE